MKKRVYCVGNLQRTALRLMSVKANKPLHLNNELPEEELKSAFAESLGTGQSFFVMALVLLTLTTLVIVAYQKVWWIIRTIVLMSGNDTHDECKLIDDNDKTSQLC